MSEHAWFSENLAGYLADGLPAEERARFEKHAGECGDCAQALAEQRAFDASMAKLFASARPKAGFENRVLIALRTASLQRRVQWVKSMRWIGSAAAVILLGVIGYGMHEFAQSGKLPFARSGPTAAPGEAQQEAVIVHGRPVFKQRQGSEGKWKETAGTDLAPLESNWADEETKYRFKVLAKSRDGRVSGKEDELTEGLDKANDFSDPQAKVQAGESDPGKLKGKLEGGEGRSTGGLAPLDGLSNSLGYGEMKEGAAARIDDLKKLHVTRTTETEQSAPPAQPGGRCRAPRNRPANPATR